MSGQGPKFQSPGDRCWTGLHVGLKPSRPLEEKVKEFGGCWLRPTKRVHLQPASDSSLDGNPSQALACTGPSLGGLGGACRWGLRPPHKDPQSPAGRLVTTHPVPSPRSPTLRPAPGGKCQKSPGRCVRPPEPPSSLRAGSGPWRSVYHLSPFSLESQGIWQWTRGSEKAHAVGFSSVWPFRDSTSMLAPGTGRYTDMVPASWSTPWGASVKVMHRNGTGGDGGGGGGVCVWVCVLHSHMICRLQAGAPGKPGVSFLRPENQGRRWCKSQSGV